MKLLLENWREFLKEGIDPRIQKQLDKILALPDVGVAITEIRNPPGISVYYVRISDVDPKRFSKITDEDVTTVKMGREIETGIPHGDVEIWKADPHDSGPCLDGYIVLQSNVARGQGPLLYEIALEWASQKGGGLAADRGIVSQYAMAVWDKYAKRSDVEKKQMDIEHPNWHDTPTIPQLTPDDPEDDCEQMKAVRVGGMDGWADTSISKMYYKDIPEVMNILRKAGRLMEEA